MAFSEETIERAWKRQEGHCAACDGLMVRKNRGGNLGYRGAWEAHHKKPIKDGGTDYLNNCALLHLRCHLKHGHAGKYTQRVSGGEDNLPAVNRGNYGFLGKLFRGLRQ